MAEVKNDYNHYYTDSQGRKQGEYKAFNGDGVTVIRRGNYVDSMPHGEFEFILDYCVGRGIERLYYVYGKLVHNFDKEPLSDEEKMLLVLKHGAPLLPKGDIC